MINTESNTVIKYRKSISAAIKKKETKFVYPVSCFSNCDMGGFRMSIDCIVSGRDELY